MSFRLKQMNSIESLRGNKILKFDGGGGYALKDFKLHSILFFLSNKDV